MFVAFLCAAVNAAWADTYSFTFASGEKFTAAGTKTFNNVDWTISGPTWYGWEGGKGNQLGSGSSPVRTATISTFGISGTISSIKINASTAKDAKATLSVSVGSSTYDTKDLTNAATNYTFTGSSSGEIVITFSQPSTSKALYILSIEVEYSSATYSITAASNNTDWGTVSLSERVITATPATGYTYASSAYTVTLGTATVVQNGNEFTVTPSSDCTITINFEAIPTYTVTLGDNNSTLTETYGSAGVTLPSRNDIGSYAFVGWSETNVTSETTTTPTIIPFGTYHPTGNVTFYPIYTKTESSGASPSAFAVGDTGDFAIVSAEQSGKYYALPTNPTVSNGKITAQEITVSETNGVKYITHANATGFTWTIASATNGYKLYDGSKYIYHSNGGSSGTNLTYGTSTSYTWELTTDGNFVTMAGMSGSTTNSRGMLFSGTTIGGYALSNVTSNGYYKIMILPIAASSTTYYTSAPSGQEKVALDNSILYVADSYTLDIAGVGGELNLSGAAANHGTLQSEIVSGSTTVDASKYTWVGNILNVSEGGNGTIVIRFYVDADDEYNAVEQIVTVTVIANPTIAYDGETESTVYDTPYTVDTDLIQGGDATLSSSNENVATVSGLTINPVAVGSTTITIATAATDIWHASSATFTLNVTAPEGKTTATTGSFVKVTSTDDIADGEYLIVCENNDVAFDGNRDDSENKLDVVGNTIEVEIIDDKIAATAATTAATFTIDARAGTIQSASGYYIGQISDANGLLTNSETAYTNTISIDAAGNAEILSSGGAYLRYNSASDQTRFRYFKSSTYTQQKDIQLYKMETSTKSVTLNDSGYLTYASVYPLDFTNSLADGYSVWQITGIEGSTITFERITGAIAGGQGVLLKGTAGAEINIPMKSSDTELTGNKLAATLAPTYFEDETMYALSGDAFYLNSPCTLKANRAYIPADLVGTQEVKNFIFVFNDMATGIVEAQSVSHEACNAIFNLTGQRLSKPAYGINIVNGRKVLIK